jgi:uncharacterized membrane protein YfcA
VAATAAGAAVGILGGLLGLGGAEFRLPLLVSVFGYPLRRAIPLNLAISFLAVLVAAIVRWRLAGQPPLASAAPVAVGMMVGGMAGAALGARWLAHISDERLHAAVRTLLVSIGVLLIVESAAPGTSAGVAGGPILQGALAALAGVIIGAVSTILGVAGGELIIPTLVLLFGVPIKAAGTTSLLISIPTMMVGLARHRARGAFHEVGEVRRVVVPMAFGTVLGSAAGGLLIAYAPAGPVKVALGVVLIASALRVFRVRARSK